MAVIPGITGVAVNIVVEGQALVEHEPTSDNNGHTAKSVTRYVESKSGAAFEIRVRLSKEIKSLFDIDSFDLAIDTVLDGNLVRGRLVAKEDLKVPTGANLIKHIQGSDEGSGQDWKHRKFMFSDLTSGEFLSSPPF
jgi:hypothetical protein